MTSFYELQTGVTEEMGTGEDNSLGQSTPKLDLMRSGFLTVIVLTCLILALVLGFRERGRGHLHKLTTNIEPPPEASAPLPGGQAAVVLTRSAVFNGASAEFLTTTLLPGLGMQILQMTASLPLKGETRLLSLPDLLQVAASAEAPPSEAANASAAAMSGGAFLTYLAERGQERATESGALSLQPTDTSENHGMPDGADVTAVFHAPVKSAPGYLPPGIELRTSMVMSGRSVDIALTARNTGLQALPLRLGWFPHLVIPSGNREQARLILPSAEDSSSKSADFSVPKGRALGTSSIDATYTHLHRSFLSNGPEAELIDPASGYALRITAISSTIHSLRIIAPAEKAWVVIAPIAEPEPRLGEGQRSVANTTPLLQPGQTLQWHVRVELVTLAEIAPPL